MKIFTKSIDPTFNDNKINSPEPVLQFKRVRKKYLIPPITADLLLSQIGSYLPKYKKTAEPQHVSSIYYDNAEWKCYSDQVKKVNPRFKILFRQYYKDRVQTDIGFLEIKRKENSNSYKERFRTEARLLGSISESSIAPEVLSLNDNLSIERLSEIHSTIANTIINYKLEPVVKVMYIRQAFESNDKTLRITFDSNLEFHHIPNSFALPVKFLHKMPANFHVMEIKYSGKIPEWLTSLLKSNKISKRRFSKYCAAVQSIYDTETRGQKTKPLLLAEDKEFIKYGTI